MYFSELLFMYNNFRLYGAAGDLLFSYVQCTLCYKSIAKKDVKVL